MNSEYSNIAKCLIDKIKEQYTVTDTQMTYRTDKHERYSLQIKGLKHWKLRLWIHLTEKSNKANFTAYFVHDDYNAYDNPVDAYYCIQNAPFVDLFDYASIASITDIDTYNICTDTLDDATYSDVTSIDNLYNMIDTVIYHRFMAYANVSSANTNKSYIKPTYIKTSLHNWYNIKKTKQNAHRYTMYVRKKVKDTVSKYPQVVHYDVYCKNGIYYLDVTFKSSVTQDVINEFKKNIKDIDNSILITVYAVTSVE